MVRYVRDRGTKFARDLPKTKAVETRDIASLHRADSRPVCEKDSPLHRSIALGASQYSVPFPSPPHPRTPADGGHPLSSPAPRLRVSASPRLRVSPSPPLPLLDRLI